MLKLQNINCLSTQCQKCLSGIIKFRYYASSSDDNFKKINKAKKKNQIMAKECHGELRNDIVNESIEVEKETKQVARSKGIRLPKVGKIGKGDGATMKKRHNAKSQERLKKKGENQLKTYQNEKDRLKSDETFDKERKDIKSPFMKEFLKGENLKSEAMSTQIIKNEKIQNDKDYSYYKSKMVDNHSKRAKKKNVIDSDDYTYYTAFMELFETHDVQEPPCIYVNGNPTMPDLVKRIAKGMKKTKIDRKTFSGLGVNKNLVGLLTVNNIIKPTRVQADSIPRLLKGRSIIIESATGSGKTLTFLLPIIQNLTSHPCSNIIIVPTRELVSQIYKEFVSYGMWNDKVSRHVSGVDEGTDKKLRSVLKNSRIFIGTPKRLLEIVESNPGYFKQVRTVVIDEVDKLLPVKCNKETANINEVKPTIEKLLAKFHRKGIQFIATSATISDQLVEELKDIAFGRDPTLVRLTPKGYKHGRMPENIRHLYAVVTEADEFSKIRVIGHLFQQSKENSILVFIHDDESVEKTVGKFEEMGFVTKALYKELLLPTPDAYGKFLKKFNDGDVQVVVSSEATVQGIDFPFLNSIYLTFVPDTPEKYLHLAGRTGRLGLPAEVLTVIGDSNAKADKDHLKRMLSLLRAKPKMKMASSDV